MNFISNHLELARERLIEQYRGLPTFEGMLKALIAPIQAIENAAKSISTERTINAATGLTLDLVGAVVGLAREPGALDEDYRLLIKSRIVQNLNQGTPEEIIAAAKFFIIADAVWYLEVYPAAVDIMSTRELTPEQAVKIRAQLEKFLPAAVSLDTLGSYDKDNAFVFDAGAGFGNDEGTEGGLLATIY